MRVGVSCTYKESGKGDGGDEVGEEEARTKNEAQQRSPKKGYKERKQWKPRHWSWGNLYYLAIFWGLSPMHRTSAVSQKIIIRVYFRVCFAINDYLYSHKL